MFLYKLFLCTGQSFTNIPCTEGGSCIVFGTTARPSSLNVLASRMRRKSGASSATSSTTEITIPSEERNLNGINYRTLDGLMHV